MGEWVNEVLIRMYDFMLRRVKHVFIFVFIVKKLITITGLEQESIF